MRELILKNSNVILDSTVSSNPGFEEASSFFTAQGDIDGDGKDEIVLCSHLRILAIIKGSQIYHIANHPKDSSLCAVHVLPISGGVRSEIITISLTGLITIYKFDSILLGNDEVQVEDPHITQKSHIATLDIPIYDDGSAGAGSDNYQNNNSKNSIHLIVSSHQSELARNATATQMFM